MNFAYIKVQDTLSPNKWIKVCFFSWIKWNRTLGTLCWWQLKKNLFTSGSCLSSRWFIYFIYFLVPWRLLVAVFCFGLFSRILVWGAPYPMLPKVFCWTCLSLVTWKRAILDIIIICAEKCDILGRHTAETSALPVSLLTFSVIYLRPVTLQGSLLIQYPELICRILLNCLFSLSFQLFFFPLFLLNDERKIPSTCIKKQIGQEKII